MSAMLYFQIPILITVVFFVIVIPSGVILTKTNNYFGTTDFAYGQTTRTNSNNANPINIQNLPVKKVHVGDIDIARPLVRVNLFYLLAVLVGPWIVASHLSTR
jgi:hypothetical protein